MSKYVDDFRFNYNSWKRRTSERIRNFGRDGYSPSGSFPWMSVISIVLGLLFIFCPLLLSAAAAVILGILLILFGIWNLVTYIRFKVMQPFGFFSLITAVMLILTGILFLTNPASLIRSVSLMLGIFFMINGGISFNRLLKGRSIHNPIWWVRTVLAGLLCFGGIFIFLFPYSGMELLFIFCGIALIIYGITNLLK